MGRQERQKVSIIVVNWNGRRLLKGCLDSLARQTYCNRELILVDNGSTDASVSVTRENFPEVKIIALRENKGFAGGNAEGLKAACGEFVALVNNDAVADERWLENLLQPMLEDPRIGICACKIFFSRKDEINSAGNGITTAAVGFNRGLGANDKDFDAAESVFGACGAAVLYRRRMLEEVGFLDEDFFLYDEDTDLSFRAQLAGWKCVYVPTAIVHHVSNATAGRLSDTHVYYHTRNLEFVWIKNMPIALMLRFAHHKMLQEIGAFCYICLRHGKWLPYLRAKRDALRELPTTWEKRKDIQINRRVPNFYLKSLMTPLFSRELILRKIRQFIEG